MSNQEIARAFNEIADMLELKGENPFRIRAYRRAAQNIEALSTDVTEMSPEALQTVPGIGKDLAGKIREFIETGSIKQLEELRREVPAGLLEILLVPGVGPRTAKTIYDSLGISSLDELERACKEGRLSGLPGIKKKTEENILKGISMLKRGRERMPLGRARPLAEAIVEELKGLKTVGRIEIAGSLRRWKETVKDIDILVTSTKPMAVMNAFVKLPNVQDVLLKGPTKSSVVLKEGIQVDLRVVEEQSFGAALQYFTGSKAHNIKLRERAMKLGLKINEYGVFREADNTRVAGITEEEVYRAVGLPFIEPELREDLGEIEAAEEGRLPNLVRLTDIKGDLHVHSKWSDGSHSIEEVVRAAMDMGYEYIAITDHSQGLGIAGGLKPEDIMEEKKEVDAINRKLKGFRVFMGVEVDIRSSGELDFDEDVLKRLDFVVASIHSGFRQSQKQLTQRLLSAIRSPYVHVIAHPTGRIIGERDEYDVDMEVVLKEAKRHGKALEINAYPLRLDLNDRYAKRAKQLGIPLVISTDTHMKEQFRFINYGVEVARRAWLEKTDILNTLPLREFAKRIKRN
ncbi:MAG: DNA polymerase/3'-5' exonuclease PolX [Nitrospirae bacterium]|nr:MAG: DNA polymerase/3'-5' exonuclease PolX [Nitrospirota bacterium]